MIYDGGVKAGELLLRERARPQPRTLLMDFNSLPEAYLLPRLRPFLADPERNPITERYVGRHMEALTVRKPDQQRLDQTEQAFKLVTEGHSYRSAAAIMGVSHETVRNRVTEYADRLILPKAEEWRKREVEQLTFMLDRLQAKIEAGNEAAIATGIRVMERKHKLLGLDAPVQVQHTVVEVTQADLEFAELAREEAVKASSSPAERLLRQGGASGAH